MTTLRRRLSPPRVLGWALWLALLLPLAQFGANTHLLSHALGDAGNMAKHAAHLAQCGQCLAAAAVGGAAPAAPAALPDLPRQRHVLPRPLAVSVWHAVGPHPYRSRAPPVALH